MSEAFLPDGARATDVAATVKRRLGESVAAIVAAMPVPLERSAGWRTIAERILGGGMPRASVFATYHELVAAVERDDVEAASRLLDAIDAGLGRAAGPLVVSWADVPPDDRDLYLRAINADPTTPVAFGAPDAGTSATGIRTVQEALAALDAAAPQTAAEIRALLTQIVLVAGTAGSGTRFDGATTFYCWGALFLNAEEHQSLVEMVDGLAHESAHALLYGLALGGPLVTNPVSERHPSPLRRDLRHLDGIYHATFVSARMHHAHDSLLARGNLSHEQADEAREGRATSAAAFAAGLRTLREHARFTPLGRDLIDSAERYMETARRAVAEAAESS